MVCCSLHRHGCRSYQEQTRHKCHASVLSLVRCNGGLGGSDRHVVWPGGRDEDTASEVIGDSLIRKLSGIFRPLCNHNAKQCD